VVDPTAAGFGSQRFLDPFSFVVWVLVLGGVKLKSVSLDISYL